MDTTKENNMIHTSDSLRAQDTDFENWHYQLEPGDQYLLTTAELSWLEFIRGRYCIHDHLVNNMVDGVYTVDVEGMSTALQDDGMGNKAVCLSDDTVLQTIFFYTS